MTKILLVEDDNNLREIYQARLAAEGYDIVAAENGEVALAIASKEKPQLIISDVMMPKISGFEMLDIIRNTDAIKDVKVIMLTALSQAEDNERAGKLGADRYLVKSQVTLEDIVKAAHDLLDGDGAAFPAAAQAVATDPPAPAPVAATPVADEPALAPAEPAATVESVTPNPTGQDMALPTPTAPVAEPAAAQPSLDAPAEPAAPVIDVAQPPADTAASAPIISTQDANADAPAPDPAQAEAELSSAQTSSQEESALKDQIDQFLATNSGEAPAEAAPATQSDRAVPADEPADEFVKDDAAPDMGALSVQQPTPEPVREPETESNPAGNESDQPAPAPDPAPASTDVTPQQSQNDEVVSSAIDSMMAANPAEPAKEVVPPSQAWANKEESAPAPDPGDLPAMTPRPIAPTESADTNPAADEAQQLSRPAKKVIEPLGNADKPDIHQLLAAEEAKNAATQAGNVINGTAAAAPAAPAEPDLTLPPAPQITSTAAPEAPPASAPAQQQQNPQGGPPPPMPGQGLNPNDIAL